MSMKVGAQLLVEPVVPALIKKIQVIFSQQADVITHLPHFPVVYRQAQ